MTTLYMPGGAASIAAMITSSSSGDSIMLAPKPSFVITQVDSATVFRVLAGQGERLRANDRLYVYDPANEATTWSIVVVSTVVGDTVTAASVTGSALAAGQIAIVCYDENAVITVGKTLRFIAQPWCSQNLTTSLHNRLRGDPGPDPRVVVYGRFNFTTGTGAGSSLSGLTVVGHDNGVVVGSTTSARVWQCVDCTVRPVPTGGTTSTLGIQNATLVRRCRILGNGVAGGNMSYAALFEAAGTKVEACLVANWFTNTNVVRFTTYGTMYNCTIAGNFNNNASAPSRGWIESNHASMVVANCVLYNNTLSGVGGNHYVLLNGTGTAHDYGCVYYNSQSGVVTSGYSDTDLSATDPVLTAMYEVQDSSPSVAKTSAWWAVQSATDMNRYVLDGTQRAVGCYAWSAYKAAAFAWTVTRIWDGFYYMYTYDSAAGLYKAWSMPPEQIAGTGGYIEWTFQNPKELLRWIEVGAQYMYAPSSASAAVVFDAHVGMNADGRIRITLTGVLTLINFGTLKNTATRWILGVGTLGDISLDTDALYRSTYRYTGDWVHGLSYLPNYFASKVAFDEDERGEWQPSNVDVMDLGGVVAMPSAVRSYRSTLRLRFVSEADDVQSFFPAFLYGTVKQRTVDFFRKLTSGTPVRVYLTNHRSTMGALRNSARVADMNALDDNRETPLAWAETVMGRYDVSIDLCEMWGF